MSANPSWVHQMGVNEPMTSRPPSVAIQDEARMILQSARPWQVYQSSSVVVQDTFTKFALRHNSIGRGQWRDSIAGTRPAPDGFDHFLRDIGQLYNISNATHIREMTRSEWDAIPELHRQQIARDLRRNINDLNNIVGVEFVPPTPQRPANPSTPGAVPPPRNPVSRDVGDLAVGDKVQVIDGAIDVTNGATARAGSMYGEGGPLWAYVVGIVEEFNTGGRFGLPNPVRKYQLAADNGTMVWQVQGSHIAGNVIRIGSAPEDVQYEVAERPPEPIPSAVGITDLSGPLPPPVTTPPSSAYVTKPDAQSWAGGGYNTSELPYENLMEGEGPGTQEGGWAAFGNNEPVRFARKGLAVEQGFRELSDEEIFDDRIGKPSGLKTIDLEYQNGETAMANPDKARVMRGLDIENIQNEHGFPLPAGGPSRIQFVRNGQTIGSEQYLGMLDRHRGNRAAKYNFQIIPGNSQLPMMKRLEDQLEMARSSLGIPVHGRNDVARAMKYYLYNRFKSPDRNLAHNKSVTHVFFTRPDLNILDYGGTVSAQVKNHTEAAMLWRRDPDLFKLLVNHKRCYDTNNFNLLLSNQVTSAPLEDEQLTYNEAGKSWNDYQMNYGDSYTGRSAGEISIGFTDTSNYAVVNLIKLWVTYIDNISRGAWMPSYDLLGTGSREFNNSHVYTKTLDYAASMYVIKCDPTGDNILYWTKYFGIFPVSTGTSAHSWQLGQSSGDSPKITIRFRYSMKRDLSPVNLIEFNHNANVATQAEAMYEASFNPNFNHSSRPYVGAPFIEMLFKDPPPFRKGGGIVGNPESILRLKFRPCKDSVLDDRLVYRPSLA